MKKINEIEAVVQSLPQGNDDLSKAIRLETILKNKFLGISVEEGLTNIQSVQKILEDLDNGSVIVGKLMSKYMDMDDDDMSDKMSDIEGNLTAMWNCLYDILEAFEKKQYLKDRLKL